ncbi:MAG TPA: hypothetical protein VHC97_06005 [Thermoanaerobaculia bacterium]|jgi:hypothetical protein|nr:hypothetical protein [Thermoanaerobaculia bacterium]
MRFRSVLPFCLAVIAAMLPALAFAAPPAKPAAAQTPAAFHRVELKPASVFQGKPLPYTIEVPADWQVRQIEGFPGLWIGPEDAKPPKDPRLIWIHGSKVSMAKPEEIVANIRSTDAEKAEWSAPRVEVKEVGGVRGVLVRMDAGEGGEARSNLTLKVPLQDLALDFVATADRTEFEKNLALYERILLSVRPVETAAK